MPVKAVSAVVPGDKVPGPDPAFLQVELQRFGDEYANRTTVALDEYAARVGTPEARRQALLWKVSVASAAVSIASGPNPRANLVDFLVIATVTRTAIEEVWIQTTNGPAFQPWLEVSRGLETDAWKMAAGFLTAEQQEEVRGVIQRWWEANPQARTGFFVRPQEFTTLIRQPHEKTDRPGSVFALVGLDPTSGLDPAVREVTRTRMFAERAMYAVQRMPFLVRWQSELLVSDLLGQEEVAAAVGSADRLSRAAESASRTAAVLPDRITAEREALLAALEAQEGRLRELAAEVSRTLAAGAAMSTSLNTTLITFDALMKRFGVGEPPRGARDTNAPPFNILDYARTAEQIAGMARELEGLLQATGTTLDAPALDRRLAELRGLVAEARGDAKSVLNHAFLLAAALLLLGFACAAVYRRLIANSQ